ncbi:cation diffusion facilitator family transporter [Aliiroseovarius sp. F47248L]|uniref:cation diffusion facilitator family transporter n=1 Tax=Aliiroseovarius sp. F47248L TaxID=2926420 RepID=UPI001FF4E131|nr:cation diffusion facilitator family transporter [Aliiroseovarius sp. F47248L]MCK0140549.1 cation diffusion facilitator family transporter [Aliiroseovarius sp. F47248L]
MSDHDHHSHDHHDHIPKNERKIAIAAILTGGFMFAELVGGLLSGSLALIADAGHMLTDFASLMLAWFAFRLARRPADWKRTYGFDRFSVLAAFVNGLSLFVIAAWITWEAIHRLTAPVEVLGGTMLIIAVLGLLVNIVAFLVLTRGEGDNLNVRAAALHVAGDLLGSVAAIVAALVILATGWTPIDPILSVLVALIILRSAWKVVRESAHILLEAAPHGFDRREVAAQLEALEGVDAVTHIHAWSVTQERPMVTMEVTPTPDTDPQVIKARVKQHLHDVFQIEHATVEINSPANGGPKKGLQ